MAPMIAMAAMAMAGTSAWLQGATPAPRPPVGKSAPKAGSGKPAVKSAPKAKPAAKPAAAPKKPRDLGLRLIAVGPVDVDDAIGEIGFRWRAPEGWKVLRTGLTPTQIAAGPAEGGFAPNVNFQFDSVPTTFADYVTATLARLPKDFPGSKAIGDEAFTTKSGTAGHKATIEYTIQEIPIRQTFWLLPSGNQVLIAVCTARVAAPFEDIFTGIALSLTVGPK
ncbi:MAG: hypothetical protein ACKO5K_16745 [Armatimonadota bacterium]